MAHLRKKGTKKWQIILELERDPITGERKRKYKTVCGTKKKAEAKMAELIQKYEKGGKLVEPKKMTMKKLMLEYLKTNKHNVATRTQDRYRNIVHNHFIPDLGHYQVSEIKPIHIESYQNHKLTDGKLNGSGGLSTTTVRIHHNLLSTIFKYGQRLELVEKNPVKLVPSPKARGARNKFLSREELKKILDYSEGLWIHDFIKVAVATGMRRGELLGLEWENVDFDKKRISVTQALKRTSQGIELSEPKTNSSIRSIAITDETIKVLKKIKSEQAKRKLRMNGNYNNENDFVFCEKDGRYCVPSTVSRRFKRVVDKLGLGDYKLHSLRHTMASWLIQIANPKVVAERLGHSSVSITMDMYSHLSQDIQQKAADDLSKLIG
jgi:integrase